MKNKRKSNSKWKYKKKKNENKSFFNLLSYHKIKGKRKKVEAWITKENDLS